MDYKEEIQDLKKIYETKIVESDKRINSLMSGFVAYMRSMVAAYDEKKECEEKIFKMTCKDNYFQGFANKSVE